ncbi:MAG: zinc metalloprotease HtpX [Acidimicrobiia bacterium]|nr:zinc metalloprotease HtpX [Acidimicrobiia bacterium]MBT8247610.1 zinc metalloprotease HtpX [Acidimicrobiia bacterium]NNJ47830.1 zinc metalloprotease HtpX [Acidimicrobiia bacterium]
MTNNNLKTVGLLAALGAVIVLVGQTLGGTSGAIIALGIAAVLNFGMYFFSDKLALKASRARPIEEGELPQVTSIVSKLAQMENMPMPKLFYIDSPQPNAFATGRSPKHAAVAVTGGILQLMTNEELEGVLAHELAHVRNRDILIGTIAATMAAALSIFARMAMWGALGGRRNNNSPLGGIIALISIILAPLAAMVIKLAITRAREYQADRTGADITGQPLALASALRKLEAGTTQIPMDVNPAVAPLYIADPLKAFGGKRDGGGSLRKLFATHPPISDRVARLEEMASPFS